MPRGVDFPRGAEFWAPVVPALASGTPPNTTLLDTLGVFYVVGRRAAVARDARACAPKLTPPKRASIAPAPGRLKWGTTAVVTPFVDYVFGPVRPALRVLWAAVGRAAADRLRQRLGADADARGARGGRSTASGWRSARPAWRSPGHGSPRCCWWRWPAACSAWRWRTGMAQGDRRAGARRPAARRGHRRQRAGRLVHVRAIVICVAAITVAGAAAAGGPRAA